MYYKIREGIRVLLAIKSCFKILPSSYIYSMVITVIHKPFQGMYTAAKAILMKLTENNKMESNLLEGAFNTFRVRIYNTYIRMHMYSPFTIFPRVAHCSQSQECGIEKAEYCTIGWCHVVLCGQFGTSVHVLYRPSGVQCHTPHVLCPVCTLQLTIQVDTVAKNGQCT